MRWVWFFGPSASGKRTKILWLADIANRRHEQAINLGLGRYDLVLPAIIPNRIRGKRGDEYQRILDRRITRLIQIFRASIDAVWLVHGQRIDIVEDVPGRVRDATGSELSLAVYLRPKKFVYEAYCAARGLEANYEAAFAQAEAEMRYLSSRFREVRVWE
jgi:hypothetical protein